MAMAQDQMPVARQPLPVELHAATRQEHAALNRTIIARLPLCLPQATSNSVLYAQGIAAIGQIYLGFEDAWDVLLSSNIPDARLRDLLTRLNVKVLRRTPRLWKSLEQLSTRMSTAQIEHMIALTSYFREEIKTAILAKPHLLMAYTWTMYLALFNGGRWIAKQLLSAGTMFWGRDDQQAVVNGALSFWFFGDDEHYNGDDLKVAFKDNFDTVSETLTQQERDEIIVETKRLFGICSQIIEILDQNVHSTIVTHEPPAISETVDNSLLSYVSSLTPTPVASLWRTLINKIPTSQTSLPISLRSSVEQKSE